MAAPTSLVMHPDCALHDTGWGHPEHQGRLPAIVQALYRDTPALLTVMLQEEAEPATVEDLRRVHTEAHVERIRAAVEEAAGAGGHIAIEPDTVVSAASWDAAVAAAGCAITATRLVLDGTAETAFAAARPPGHHATPSRAMGFCLFNNVAIAARWAQRSHGIRKILIVDFDIHHGNGTQDVFYDDPDVYYLSLHASPHYPGTGAAEERGAGDGRGTTRNVPLPMGTSATTYRKAFEGALAATLAEFAPELVLVSAGFDILAGDPLGGFGVEPIDIHGLTTTLLDATRASAQGRVVTILEGGYVPKRVGEGVVQMVRALAGLPPKD